MPLVATIAAICVCISTVARAEAVGILKAAALDGRNYGSLESAGPASALTRRDLNITALAEETGKSRHVWRMAFLRLGLPMLQPVRRHRGLYTAVAAPRCARTSSRSRGRRSVRTRSTGSPRC